MSRDDQAVLLGWLLIILGLILATTPWWRAAIALVPSGLFFVGLDPLWVNLKGGFSENLGWTDEEEGDIE